MDLLVAWVVFPLVLVVLCLGLGLLVERATGRPLGVLLLPCGFAALVVLAQLPTLVEETARFTTAVVVVVAGVGLVAARPDRLPRIPTWPTVAALATFAVYAAPIVLSGSATFAGFIKLDDTATFLALVDRALEHGRSIAGLAPSTYEATLDVNLTRGYPLGSLLPLGVGGALVREDIAWLFQPYMAFAAALLALVLYVLAGTLVRDDRLRAAVAFVAAQPALLYAYSLWGGVKEIVAALLFALVAAGIALLLDERPPLRASVPLALAAGALLGALSLGGGVWLVVPFAAALILLWREGPRRLAARAAVVAVLIAIFAAPALVAAADFLRDANTASFQQEDELGNLAGPLEWQQSLGVWPSGDFRLEPERFGLTRVLLIVVALALVGAVAYAIRTRRWAPVVFAAAAFASARVFVAVGSPWVAAKALAIASPALLFAAAAGAAVLAARSRAAGVALLAVIAFGVLWSNALAYSEANLAPRDRLAELEQIGKTFAGAGPALLTDYEVYGARHFLRDLDPESASELRRRYVYLSDGTSYLDKGQSADIDEFQTESVLAYTTLVLRRGPAASRPPSPYALAHEGRYYTVWVKTLRELRVLDRVVLGDETQPGGTPECADLRRLASLPGVQALNATAAPHAVTLQPRAGAGGGVDFTGAVTEGEHDVFLGGSFRGSMLVEIGSARWSFRHELNWPNLFTPLFTVALPAGAVTVTLHPGGADVRPGSGGPSESFGPVVLTPKRRWETRSFSPADWRSLCGRSWDWVEAVAPPPSGPDD